MPIERRLGLMLFCIMSIENSIATNNCKCNCSDLLQQDVIMQTQYHHDMSSRKFGNHKNNKSLIREQNEIGTYDNFDIEKLRSKKISNEIMSGSWQLENNCITDKNVIMEDSIFEITGGVRFETQINSMACIDLDGSTLLINKNGKYVHQSNNANTLNNESKIIFSPDSHTIWNSQNYRLFDATGNTLFIAYPNSVIDGGIFNGKNATHYLIDGNNKTSTIYLNRINYDSPNIYLQAILYDMNVVLPKYTNDKYNLVLDESTHLYNCSLYPNLYFKNCAFSNEDYTKTVDVTVTTDWCIKGNYNNDKNNTKAILSKRELISDNQISNDSDKFVEYDIEFGYTKTVHASDDRSPPSSLFDGESKSEYNISHIGKYKCYFDLIKLNECFQTSEDGEDILDNIPNILNAGLIGNNNIKLINHNINKEHNEYSVVKLYGDNTEYYGIIFISDETKNITFGENSYARVDLLFEKKIQTRTRSNTKNRQRYIIDGSSQPTDKRIGLDEKNISLNENGIRCNVVLDGSNKVVAEGQYILDLNITKNARSIKIIPYDKDNKYVFNIEGALNLEEYVETNQNDLPNEDKNNNGILVIEEGVQVKA